MKKILNKFNFKKTVAVFTAVTFIFTGVIGNSAFASVASSMPAINAINFDIPIIPTSLGKITSAKYFDSEDIIINIQDLHCHAETQRKIASIIGYLDNTYNLKNVYLEGAFKTVDTSWLSAFNNNQNGTKILEGLVDSGKLSGTEYYSVINNKKNFVLGIENEELYKENIKLLGSIIELQPEVNAICAQLEKEISKIKRDYSSRQARKLEKLIKSFKKKETDAKTYYSQLIALVSDCNLSIEKYPNIKIYISLLDKAQYINNKKVVYEFSQFVSEIKNILPYQQYSELLKKSNNFNNLDDISSELIELEKNYSITEKLKLNNFNKFLAYLEFNQNINPVKLIQEEENFINELYVKLGRTKYEKEVAFMFDFIPTIQKYFSADISADEYYKFEKNYNLFKTIWPSYFSSNILKNLEQYQKLLSKYHKNNITRDHIFAESLITQKNTNNNVYVNDINLAIKTIKTNLNNKKIKLVVTGGFHTRGLEKIFEQQKISYVIITPKITQPIEQAKQIYIDNVMYYSNILKNTINLEPLTQEPLNVSFPKILNLIFSEIQNKSIFEDYSKNDLKQAIKEFVQEYIVSKQPSLYGQVEILNWDIISEDLTGKIEFVVSYRDNANKQTISTIRYQFVDGNIIPYSSIDVEKTKQMLERITNNKYAQPSIELEPTDSVRKKIAKNILEPLQKVVGNSVSLMPAEQLHMTIGYDSTPMTQDQIDALVETSDINDDIFSVLDVLGNDFVNFKTSVAGTLKLMPDGVIIYEITDKTLIEKMLQLRTTLKDNDSKYGTPSIVHMSIGRIADKTLLDGSEQSKQELAELLEKINETIYEINKKNALSKIKTNFTLKSGYVSSTGDKDFVFRRILPKKESLIIFKNLFDSSKSKLDTINKVIIAPVLEEVIFRFIPFLLTGLLVPGSTIVIPSIVTMFVSFLGFSVAHPLADKINNYFYKKIEEGKITNKFISKLFTKKLTVRDIKDFILPSASLTYIFLAIPIVAPQAIYLALAISVLYHSLNNWLVIKKDKGPVLTVIQGSSQDYEDSQNKYVPEYQSLFSFVPKSILDLESSKKYFEISSTEQTKKSDVNKEKEFALDRLLKNGNSALANISHSADDLKIAVSFIEKMLQDLKLISSDTKKIGYLEETLSSIKSKIEQGNIDALFEKPSAFWLNDERIYALISDINEKAISETKTISDKFEAFKKVLENNELALSSLTRMNEESVNDTIYFIEEMLDAFEIISPETAQETKIALLEIKKNIKEGNVNIETLSKLNSWRQDSLDKIKELHTLINAVHQTATNRLMKLVQSSSDVSGRKIVLKQDGIEQLSFYDCSAGPVKEEMKEFFVTLSEIEKGFKGVCVTKDNKLLYSKQLGIHSVNILVDLEEGIRVTFNESSRGDGNALRTVLLATLFAQSGFDIANIDDRVEINKIDGVCSFTAVCNLKNDFNTPEKYAFLFSQALQILSDTKDLDFELEDDNDAFNNDHFYGKYYIPKLTLEDYRKMKNSLEMPKEFGKGITGKLVTNWVERIGKIKLIRNNFEKIKQEEKGKFSKLYDYLKMDTDKTSPWDVVSEYVKGKLIINDEGLLEKNNQYDGINVLLDAIETNVDDSLKQAQVINLLNDDIFHYETEGYIGGMVALSGLLRLDDKGWLSVKTAVDKERKRAKFAYVEFVDFKGDRTRLNYKELIKILKDFGYEVKEQQPRSRLEKDGLLTILKEKILFPKDGIYTRGMSVSGQADKYIPVKITYDKNNVDENSMWVVSYTSPEDVSAIIKAGAIMTTTGGMLSHANITARENNKTAILSNGQWVDGKLEVPYYSIESNIEQRRGYEIQKISEHSLVLKEGTVVLANGINGRVLVYDQILPETISDIQNAIDNKNVKFINEYLKKHSEDSNIRQIVEYIFLQVITDKENIDITKLLLSKKEPKIKETVSKLSAVYVGEKIKALKSYIENEQKIKDAKIRISVLGFIYKELDVLKYYMDNNSELNADILDELKKIEETFDKDYAEVSLQLDSEVDNILAKANKILSKPEMSEQDKDDLVKISEGAKVWNFYNDSEIITLIPEIDRKISSETGTDYKTEIRDFENIRAKDVARYGTKTTELAKLSRSFKKSGIKIATVPHGVGISKDVLGIFFENNGFGEKYSELIEKFQQAVKSKNKEKAIETGREISKLIESVNDDSLENYIKSKLDDGKRYAVRSSGVGEDGANHAFAGMAKTMLNVEKDNVYKSVKDGWKSFFTDTCIEDMIKEGIVVQPALLVQEMVVGVEKAGVMFTRDNSGNLTMEAVLGLGEGLVSGRITPDHISVRASDGRIEYRRALDKMIKIEEKPEGGTRVAKITNEEKIERILDEETIRQLQEIADMLEEDAGYPVDIEFAIDKYGKIYVLQRRAITTIEFPDMSSVPVIEQSLVDNIIKNISVLSKFGYDRIPKIIKQLSNLPENREDRYDVVIQQIYSILDLLKEQHYFEQKEYGSSTHDPVWYFNGDDELKKFCVENKIVSEYDSNVKLKEVLIFILSSIVFSENLQNSESSLFYPIVDYWFVEKKDRGGVVFEEMIDFADAVYSVNPKFFPYILDKLIDANHISLDDEHLPWYITSKFGNKPDALKQYYFAVSSREKVDEILSSFLKESLTKLNNIVNSITDKQIKDDINEILLDIDDLTDKINSKNVQLLEESLNNLFEKAINLKDINKKVSFEIIGI
ncbi:MAG: hypothetical protein K5622_02870, partial [Endomicrobiaceae bacterium]|nr:hypothetical protein [Endomicrobiaceae bacterium]